jgi:hypothetical protein
MTSRNRATASVALLCLLALGMAGCHMDRPSGQPPLPTLSEVEASYGPQTLTWSLADGYVDRTISMDAFSARGGCRGSGTLKISVYGADATKDAIDLTYECTGRLGEMWALYKDPKLRMSPPYTIKVSAEGDITGAEYFVGP